MRARWLVALLAPLLPLGLLVIGQQVSERGPDATYSNSGAGHSAPPSSGTSGPATAGAPNILVVTMDDMRWDDLRWTPTVRREIQSRGLTFANSFAPNPLCCPSRASFLNGQYSHHHGVLSHLSPYGFGSFDDSVTLAGRMQQAGYRTGFTGKYLNGYGYQDSLVTRGPSQSYVPAGWDDWRAGLQAPMEGTADFHGGTYAYFDFTQNVNGGQVENVNEYSSKVIADDTIELTKAYHRERRPWFVWMNPVAPHHGSPFEPDDPPIQRLPDGRRMEYPTPARPGWVKGRFDAEIRRSPGVPSGRRAAEADVSDKPRVVRRLPEEGPGERAASLELARQRAESMYAWDREFARVVTSLKRTGAWADTVVIFTSDNGFLLGEHRLRNGKIWSYEESVRVPLIVAGPGVQEGRRMAPATTMDVTATVLDLAGAGALPAMDGASLKPVLTGPDKGWTRAVVLEGYHGYYNKHDSLPERLTVSGLRTGRWKLVHWSQGFTELYDLKQDPLELNNLAAMPAYRDTVNGLDQLWRSYADCEGAACRAPLPAQWRVGVKELAAIDAHALAARRDYYGPLNQP